MSGDLFTDTFLSRQQIDMVSFFLHFSCVFICLTYSKIFTYGLLVHTEIIHRQGCWWGCAAFWPPASIWGKVLKIPQMLMKEWACLCRSIKFIPKSPGQWDLLWLNFGLGLLSTYRLLFIMKSHSRNHENLTELITGTKSDFWTSNVIFLIVMTSSYITVKCPVLCFDQNFIGFETSLSP